MSRLADLVEKMQDEIIRRWREEVTSTITSEALPKSELLNSLPLFLTELAKALRDNLHLPLREWLAHRSDTATIHGSQRFRMGFDVATVVREYAILHGLLLEVANEATGSIDAKEYRLLSKYLLSGVADAVTEYALEKDEELKRQTAKHLGFLAHEIRNPLASARLSVAIMKRKGTLGENRSAATLERSLCRMDELIDRSLIEVRLNATKELQLERFELKPFVEEVAADSFVEDDDRGLTLKLQVEEGAEVEADRKLLYSATTNLVRNALKFSRVGGGVQLRVKTGDGRVVIEVEDECGGLPDGQVEKLFSPFVQMGQDRSGFGLGLAIADQAAHAHGGNIRIHNLPGKGCIFVLDLPERPSAFPSKWK